jgi:DNA polymerase II small subunit/DNA polymerase delta subunit B
MRTYIFILGGISSKKADVERLFNALPKDSFKIFLSSKNDAIIEKRDDCLHSIDPMMVEIEGIKFLLYQGDELHAYEQLWGSDAENILKNLLKRRDLNPLTGTGGTEGMALAPSKETIMDQPPDVFASGGFHSSLATTYKGVSIITTGDLLGEATFWVLNLKTREINKLSLQ